MIFKKKKVLLIFSFFFLKTFLENLVLHIYFCAMKKILKKFWQKKHKKVTETIMLCFPKNQFSCCDQQLFSFTQIFWDAIFSCQEVCYIKR
jgi:hypothetical protein